MSLFSDQPPPTSPPTKPKLAPEERRACQADQLTTIRLRIGEALGMLAAKATKLLTRREGDVALLQAATAQLGQMPGQ